MKNSIQVYNPNAAPQNIQQPYSLTKQLQNFDVSIHEMRVVLRILEMLKKNQNIDVGHQLDMENKILFQFPVKAFMVEGHKNYDDVRIAIKKLRDRSISADVVMEVYEDGLLKSIPGEKFMALIEDPIYAKNNSYVQFKVSADWFKFLTDLSRGYTKYASNIAFQCSKVESVKFYQYINHWFAQKGITLKMHNFKKEFGIPKNYNISKIEKRILMPIKSELDILSDKSFNYTFYYTDGTARDPKKAIRGKVVEKITMSFYQNHKNTNTYSLDKFEHKETNKWIAKITPRYKLTEENTLMLYGLVRKWGYTYLTQIEIEERKKLKAFQGREFLDNLGKIVFQQKHEKKAIGL